MKQTLPPSGEQLATQTGRGRREQGGLCGNTGAGGLAPAAGGWHCGWGGEGSAYRQLGGSSRGGGAEALRPAWRPHLQ